MRKDISAAFVIIALIIFSIFIIKQNSNKIINVSGGDRGENIKINICAGKAYLHKYRVNSILSIKTPPQIAIWIEDTHGNYIETLYVTHKAANKSWGKTVSGNSVERPEALPCWSHRASGNPGYDAVTSATPRGSSTINARFNGTKGIYKIFAEVNHSVDYNDSYKANSDDEEGSSLSGVAVNGQPGVIYMAEVNFGENNKTYEMKLIGTSSVEGSDGKIYDDISKLTTAREIISKITITK